MRSPRLIESHVKTLVDLALVLGAEDRKMPDVAGPVDVRPATGLRIEALDLDHAHAPLGHGWSDLQGTQQILAPAEFLLGNVVRLQRMIAREHSVDLRFQLGTQRGRETFQLEIDPGIALTDLDARDPAVVVAQRDRIEHVQNAVIARECETTIAIYREMCCLPDDVARECRS